MELKKNSEAFTNTQKYSKPERLNNFITDIPSATSSISRKGKDTFKAILLFISYPCEWFTNTLPIILLWVYGYQNIEEEITIYMISEQQWTGILSKIGPRGTF